MVKTFFMVVGIIATAVVAAFVLILWLVKRSVGSKAIDMWFATNIEDKKCYMEFISGKEWRARFPEGRIVKGTWNSKKCKSTEVDDVYAFHLEDEEGNTYRMEYNCSDEETVNEWFTLLPESGESLIFKRSFVIYS